MIWIVAVGIVLLVAVAIYDLTQRQHAILRTFPIIGHFRYWLEAVGPELRQYIVTDNNEERPFSRDQRRWIYASAKRENNYFGFGSDNEMELQPNYLIIKHDTFPLRGPSSRRSGVRSAVPDSVRESDGRRPGQSACVSAGIDRQRVGNELRVAERAGGGGAQSRQPDCRLPSEHGRRRRVVAPLEGRRSGVAGRHRLLRMSRTRRSLQHGETERHDRARAADSRDRDQAESGRKAGRRRVAAASEDHAARSPRFAAFRWTATASARPRTARSGTPTRCSISSSRSPAKPAFRSGSSPPSAIRRSGRIWRA